MAVIVVTWDNPMDLTKTKAADAKAKNWRKTVLKQPGLVEYNAFTSLAVAGRGMAVDTFATTADAGTFLVSGEFAKIVSEMTELGVTNIKTELFTRHPDVPNALRPATLAHR